MKVNVCRKVVIYKNKNKPPINLKGREGAGAGSAFDYKI